MTKKRKIIILLAGAAYLAAIGIMALVESASPDASIHSFGDALWYSIVTLTTVGYGDMYPVTPVGRIIGVAVVICSLGLLSAVISGILALMTGYMLPLRHLRKEKSAKWNIFTEDSREAQTMASMLPGETTVFLKSRDSRALIQQDGCYYTNNSLDWLLRQKGNTENCRIFCFGTDGWENASRATQLAHEHSSIPVIALTECKADRAPENLILFDQHEGIARSYWQKYPLRKEEKQILLIGCGAAGKALLERALLTNVPEEGALTYTVVGDSREFRKLHHVLCIEKGNPLFRDTLHFIPSVWDVDAAVFEEADRIILCQDEASENLALCQKLTRQFALRGKLYMTGTAKALSDQILLFGADSDIFDPEMVLQEKRNRLAKKMHDLYKNSVSYPVPDWTELSEFHRQSNIAAADHLLNKCLILLDDPEFSELRDTASEQDLYRRAYNAYRKIKEDPERADVLRKIEHDRWLRFHLLHNWQYAPVRDNAARKHPLIIPYEELAKEEQIKDDSAWDLLGELS